MNWLARLLPGRFLQRLLHLVARRRMDREMADEIQEHLDEKIEDLVAGGMSRADATSAARRAFGNVTLTAERGHDVWGWTSLETWWVDLRYACRQLRKYPAFTLVAVLSSALGIGASTAVFSVLYAVLINPYPYRDPARIVHLHVVDKGAFLFDLPLSNQQFREFERSPVLDAAMAMDVEGMAATGGDLPEPISAGYLSANAFEFLGVPPLLGRVFTRNEARPQGIVLSYGYWWRRYSGQPDIVGQTVRLDYQSYTVIGVMPRRFAWWDCDVYLPLRPSPDPDRLATVFARITPGVSDRAAEQALQSLVGTLAAQRPGRLPPAFQIRLLHMTAIATGRLSGTLAVVGAAVGLLLVIGCANVSILLLARGAARTHELAIRVAVGASRIRILRQLLTESILISLVGGAAGVLLADGAVDLISILLPAGTFPSESVITLSTPVLVFSTLVAIMTGTLFGLWPALQFSHPEFGRLMTGGSRGSRCSRASRGHDLLIAGQAALTLVLLAGAGATGRAFTALLHTRLDYDPQNLTSTRIDLRDGTYTEWNDRVAYYDRIRQATARSPGVVSAALSLTELPPVTLFRSSAVELSDRSSAEWQTALLSEVSAEYFSTLRVPMLQGRAWTEAETRQAVHVAVVNATMARRYWPSGSPLQQVIRLPELKASTTWTLASPGNDGRVRIVGVVADTPSAGLKEPSAPTVYVPYSLVVGDSLRVITRTTGAPAQATVPVASSMAPSIVSRAIAEQLRSIIQTVDPDQPVGPARTAVDLLEAQGWARERLTASIFGAFAGLGVLLSAAGLYSVVSYVVSQRLTEFGIRMALGARRLDVVRLVLASAMRPMLTGVTAGLGLCMIFNRLLVRWTEANVRDPYVMMPVILLLVGVTVAAALVPACRAAATNPMNVLRGE
jgi:putative ABC transport system permease protein